MVGAARQCSADAVDVFTVLFCTYCIVVTDLIPHAVSSSSPAPPQCLNITMWSEQGPVMFID